MQRSVTLSAPVFMGLSMAIRGREVSVFLSSWIYPIFLGCRRVWFSVKLGFSRRALLSKTSLTDRVFRFGEDLECIFSLNDAYFYWGHV